MNRRNKILAFLILIFLTGIVVLQIQEFKYPEPKEINERLNYLKRVINQPLEPCSEIMLIGNENYEFMLFSYSFATYALTNLAIRDTAYINDAIELIKESIEKVLDPNITYQYNIGNPFDKQVSIPEYSVLYLGHINLMMGCYRLLTQDSTFSDLNDRISKSLFNRYNNADFLNLESYPSAIWIPDNTVALASLKLHSINTNSNYDTICHMWTKYAKSHYLDKETGVLFSTVNPKTGLPLEEPRGSMLGWSIMFIYQFDSEFAVELYNNYKKNFSRNFIIFRFFRERYDNRRTSMGDMDSGPIICGFSIPANEFALTNSVLARDFNTAIKLQRLIDLGTKKIKRNNEIKYKVRFMNMNISPMAEAMVLHSLTITNWIED